MSSSSMSCINYYRRRQSTLIIRFRRNASPTRSTATGRYVSSRGMASTPEQLKQLVFCAAVFREVVRLRPSGPILFHTCMVGTAVMHCLIWFKDSGFPTSRPKNRQTVYASAVLETVHSVDQYRLVDGANTFSTLPPAPRSPAPFLLSCHKIGRPHDEQRIQDKERTGGNGSHSFCQHLRRKLHKGCGIHTRKVRGKECWISRR